MNKLYFLVTAILLTACGHQDNIQSKYYANLVGVVSPFMEYTPQGLMTQNEADSIGRYYKFTFDGDQLASIKYFKRNRPSSASYFRTHEVRYGYNADKLTRSYYTENGAKAIMWRHYYQGGNIHEEEYTIDQRKSKSNLVLKDSTGLQISSGDGVHRFSWTQVKDNVILQTQYDSLGAPANFRKDIPFEKLIINIDRRGFAISLTRVNDQNKPENHPAEKYATLELLFDDFGNELGWRHLDENNNLVDLPNEFRHAEWRYEKQYANRRFGHLDSFSESYFDKNGERVQNEDSVHQVQYVFNGDGDLVELAYFNVLLEKQRHLSSDFFRAELEYDSAGNRIALRKYGVDGKLVD